MTARDHVRRFAAVLSSVAILALGGCGTATPAASNAPGATATGAMTPTPSIVASVSPTGSVDPSLVDASDLDVPLRLTLVDEWTLDKIDPSNLDLQHGDVDLGIHPIVDVTLPGPTDADPWIAVPTDFIAWIAHRPEYVPGKPKPVTFGGRTGTQIDAEFVWAPGTPERDLVRFTSGAWKYDHFDAGAKVRFVILPGALAGDGVMVVMIAPDAQFDAVAASLDKLLATLTFTPPAVYHSGTFELAIGLTLVGGWYAAGETAHNLDLKQDRHQLDVGVMSMTGLQTIAVDSSRQPWPTDFMAWLASQPEFKPGALVSTKVGGRAATQIDVDVELGAGMSPRSVLGVDGNNWNTVKAAERWRFVVVPFGGGKGVVILMPASPLSFVEAAVSLDRLLATLTFE